MKIRNYIIALFVALAIVSCKEDETTITFNIDKDTIQAAADGGQYTIAVSADERWTAEVSEPWITVSPANGNGSVECTISIDSTLVHEQRSGSIRIKSSDNLANVQNITVQQLGYDYSISLENPEVSIDNYVVLSDRYFEVEVLTNVDFDVVVPTEAKNWLPYTKSTAVFDRGMRPRKVKVRFDWGINSIPEERMAQVQFVPKQSVTLAKQDALTVKQGAGQYIPEDTRQGDSLALLALARSTGASIYWDTSLPMDRWDDVVLWEDDMPGWTAEKDGRIRAATISFSSTFEGVPYEVKYLTAADELVFFSNSNAFLKSINLGDYITELTQLKRLTLYAYGLTDLGENFSKLENLEYLNIYANNFQSVPSVLTKENFPALKTLFLGANQRNFILDLSNASDTELGGYIDDYQIPVRLLEWGLDTLNMSVNYFQGSVPSMDHMPKYTQEIIDAADTLPQILLNQPIVMSNTKHFTMNLNRLTGEIPLWLLYHPMLNYWDPQTLVFNQEGIDANGDKAIFTNLPSDLDYYFDAYPTKPRPTDEIVED